MIGHGRIVCDDLLSIAHRLKSIDSSYFVVENYKKKRLELHSNAQRGSTLALVLPFRVLDERTINKVLKTRVERAELLKQELEQDEKKRKAFEIEKAIKNAERRVEECLR